ncbi:MAG: cyclic-di-AMP receptor [Clostridia bacterium]|nr:cyclic-di-AMP receptor [Clostridia bacterium]
MKMIFAIVNNDDAPDVMKTLNQERIPVTKLASTGGFLMKGNTTFISGVEDNMVDHVIELIKEHSKRRTQLMPIDYSHYNAGVSTPYPVEITIGGATVFVVDIEKYEKA